MGWGCYRHECDAGSEKWKQKADALCDTQLELLPRSWGRDGEICPFCYEELAWLVENLNRKLSISQYDTKAQAKYIEELKETIEVLESDLGKTGMIRNRDKRIEKLETELDNYCSTQPCGAWQEAQAKRKDARQASKKIASKASALLSLAKATGSRYDIAILTEIVELAALDKEE